MAKREGLFPTFFLSGFECSTFRWKDHRRRNLVEETRHREHAQEDYAVLRSLGIAVSREGIPWPMVDHGGEYDFSCIDPMLDAMSRCQVLPIWDLFHYGYPDDADPFAADFADRFARYCRAAAAYVIPRLRGPYFFTPINEITFFSFAAGEWGWTAPYKNTKEDNYRLRLALCRADIAAAQAIREVEPTARMIHIDPLVNVVAPKDRPDLQEAARRETYDDTYFAWDVLTGKRHPELGGSPEILDIVGVNCYSFGQMEYREHGPHQALPPDDDRVLPLCDLLEFVWKRYQRPMIIGETSGLKDGRTAWLKDVMQESMAALLRGVDLHGICLYPGVDMQDWHNGEWLHSGICDLVPEGNDLRRVPADRYIGELRRWQKLLNRVTVLDEDPFSDAIDLEEVLEGARRYQPQPDKDWS